MTNSLLALASASFALSLLGLLSVGSRWRRPSRTGWIAYTILVVGAPAILGAYVWGLPDAHVIAGAATLLGALVVVARWRSLWNPAGQAFLASLLVTSAAFLATTAVFTFGAGLSVVAIIASCLLVFMEAFAFVMLLLGTHEVVDVVARTRWERKVGPAPLHDPIPFVSVQVAAHNEPAELVIGSLRSLRALDYPSYEVIVLDNNTDDESLWRPVKDYCDEIGFRFVRLVDWPGFKAGALNHGLEIADERTEIIALVDADFVVEPNFLRETVGHFADPEVAIVQTAQDFRVEAERESEYLRRLALTYKAFDEVTMPSRNERNAIIFAGTMGLIRKSALETVGGWSEWCVTEDAETSLRILARGYSSIYVERAYGRGVMPLTFGALKKQRFRWCFGGVQVLRKHWRLLVTGHGRDDDGTLQHLTVGQRFDYLGAGLQWFQGLLTLLFSLLLLAGVLFEAVGIQFRLRPLVGLFVAVPLLLLVGGVVKSLWGLRARVATSWRDAFVVMGIWLSLSWAVTLAATQAVLGKQVAFLRTPKFEEHHSIRQALLTTRAETPLAVALGAGAMMAFTGSGDGEALFVGALCSWGAIVYAAAPATALAASRVELSSSVLRRRRALEQKGGRSYGRSVAYGLATAIVTALLLASGSSLTEEDGNGLSQVFSLPDVADDQSPVETGGGAPEPTTIGGNEDSLTDRGSDGGRSQSETNGNGNGRRKRNEAAVSGPTSGASGAPAPPGPAATPAPAAGGNPSPGAGGTPAPQSTERPSPSPHPEPASSPTARPTPKGTPRNGSDNGRP